MQQRATGEPPGLFPRPHLSFINSMVGLERSSGRPGAQPCGWLSPRPHGAAPGCWAGGGLSEALKNARRRLDSRKHLQLQPAHQKNSSCYHADGLCCPCLLAQAPWPPKWRGKPPAGPRHLLQRQQQACRRRRQRQHRPRHLLLTSRAPRATRAGPCARCPFLQRYARPHTAAACCRRAHARSPAVCALAGRGGDGARRRGGAAH